MQALTVGLNLGPGLAGNAANLRAQLRNTAGATVGGLVATGFTEVGNQGTYAWHYAAYPDGFEGTVEFSIAGTIWFIRGVNAADFGVVLSTSATAIAAAVWAYATRTVTMAAAALAAAIQGTAIVMRRGDTISISMTGLGNITARTKLWFTVKESERNTDAQAILQIIETTGLVVLNGAAAATPAQGALTVTDATAGNVTITLAATASDDLQLASGLYWDIQMAVGTTISTLAEGSAKVIRDATRSVS